MLQLAGLGSSSARLGTGWPVLQKSPIRVFRCGSGIRVQLMEDLLTNRTTGSIIFQKKGIFVTQLGLEIQLFWLLEGEFLRISFRNLHEKIFPLHRIEADDHFFINGIKLDAEALIEVTEIGDSSVESIFAHFEVVPEDVVFELSDGVSAGRERVATVFGYHYPEWFEARDRNRTVFVDFLVDWFFFFFLEICVCEEFHSSIGLAVFLQDEKGTPSLELNVRFFVLNNYYYATFSENFISSKFEIFLEWFFKFLLF